MEFDALIQIDQENVEKHTAAKGDWIIEGYGATSDLDTQNHIINQDALNMGAECLKKYDTVLFNHDMDRPIGKIRHCEAQAGKLFVKVAISKSEPTIWQKIVDKTLDKFSIRGRVTDSEWKKDALTQREILEIKGMELHEVSLVSVPANVNARSISHYIEKAMAKEKDELTITLSKQDVVDIVIDKIKNDGIIKEVIEKEMKKGGNEMTEEEKKAAEAEALKKAQEEEALKKAQEEEEAKKKAEAEKDKQFTLNVGALRDVITQLQTIAKDVSDKAEVVTKAVESVNTTIADITKSKDEISKMLTSFNDVVKDLPLRQAQAQEEEARKQKEEDEKDFTKSEKYQKASPQNRLSMVLQAANQGVK